jgi:periplasmic copper chaperone A
MNVKSICLGGFIALGLASAAIGQVTVDAAWVRSTSLSQQATGAYMKITSSEAVKLVGVSTPLTKIAEVHEMKMDGDIMRMRALTDGFAIPANKLVELKPNAYHIMMQDLKQPIVTGTSIPLQLHFLTAANKKITVSVNAKASFKNPY